MTTPSSFTPETVKKIAVLRANALGDFIFSIPALAALRRTFPGAEIVLLGKPWHTKFVPGRVQAVDRVVVTPRYKGLGEPEDYQPDEAELTQFFLAMQAEHFDIALQMHGGGGNSNPFVSRLGAGFTAGMRDTGAPALDATIAYVFHQNEIMRQLEVAAMVGASTSDIMPEVIVLPEDYAEARSVSRKHGLQARYLVLHPGATDPRRQWPPEHFAEVARHYMEQGYGVAVTAVAAEADLAERICAAAPGAINLTDTLSMGGLAALLSASAVVLSNDTGPLHLANAVGARTAGIYWVGNVITAGPPRVARHRPLVSFQIDCPVCGVPTAQPESKAERSCPHNDSIVAQVSPDYACRMIDQLLV
ncbi:glycosyltransferase family 9 protein [Candidatus Saccharibacteria bacterium]|nr:glycosyltransferase family 9 protein [Candidatus Saccharibacteria bacterium]